MTKPVEELVEMLKTYVLMFKDSEKVETYLEYVSDLPAFLFFAEDFAQNKQVLDLKAGADNELIKKLSLSLARNYLLMTWGKVFEEDNEELFKAIPALNILSEEFSEKHLDVLNTLISKTTAYCYENSYKTKYFNEYVINYKNQQYYLRGDKQIPPLVAFDLDGTVVNSNERIQKMQNKKDKLDDNLSKVTKGKEKFKILRNFHSNVDTDKPYEHMIKLINLYKNSGFEVMVLTARPNEYLEVNKEFIKKWELPFDLYVGRPINNGFPDTEGKYSWLNENVAKERVRGFFEDRKEIVEYFNKKGKVYAYDVEDFHKNQSNKKMQSLVNDCLNRKNVCEDYFKLSLEKEKMTHKNFYKKAEEYYEKRRGKPYSEVEAKLMEEKNKKFRPNIS